MAPDSALSKRHVIAAVSALLAHDARTAARPGGIRYLARRTVEESQLQEIVEPLTRLCRLENLGLNELQLSIVI
jgi:hypothetical protein